MPKTPVILPPGQGHNGGPPLYDPAESFLTDAQVEKRWNVRPATCPRCARKGPARRMCG
jgi:hypothetical protein